MTKVFVSQPMNGKSNEEILRARNNVFEWACDIIYVEAYRKNGFKTLPKKPVAELIDSFFGGAPVDAKPLWYLGESLKKLAEADIAVFCKGWQHARGCRIEHEAAVAYGIEVWYE